MLMTDPIYTHRAQCLLSLASKLSCDAVVIEDPTTLFYLTGLHLSAGRVIAGNGKVELLVDGRYIEQCRQHAPFPSQLSSKEASQELLKVFNVVGFDAHKNSYSQFAALKGQVADNCELRPINNLCHKLRAVKDETELDALRAAARLGSEGFDFLCRQLKLGVTENQLKNQLESFWRERGGSGFAFDPIIAFGEHSALPHYTCSDRALEHGDSVLIDIGVTLNHYHSDMTRTMYYGTPTDELIKIYQIVKKAQAAAVAAVRPGITCSELDAVARSLISDAGYGDAFSHSLGHGVGLEVHEYPGLRAAGPDVDQELEPGMVITIEPGIYLPGLGGVRIEDTVIVTEKNHEHLTLRNKELHIIGN